MRESGYQITGIAVRRDCIATAARGSEPQRALVQPANLYYENRK